jgi:hypothetical protein
MDVSPISRSHPVAKQRSGRVIKMYQQKYSRVPNFFVTALQNLGAAPRKFIANPLGLSRYGDSPNS